VKIQDEYETWQCYTLQSLAHARESKKEFEN